jgi:hypothetical protein
MIYGCVRVSTDGQSVDAQVRQLTKAGCKQVFRETAPARPNGRPIPPVSASCIEWGADDVGSTPVPMPLIRIRAPLFKCVVIVSIMPGQQRAGLLLWELMVVRKLLDDALQCDRGARHYGRRRGY